MNYQMLKTGLSAVVFYFLAITGSPAHEFRAGDLFIDHPWARATIGRTPNGSAYLSIENQGTEADRLTGVATDVAERAELHRHIRDGDIMRMRPVEGGVSLAPGETVVFVPGAHHIMLFGLKAPLREGETFPLTLTFEKSGTARVIVNVESAVHIPPSDPH